MKLPNLKNPRSVRMLGLAALALVGVLYLRRNSAGAAVAPIDASTAPVDPTALGPLDSSAADNAAGLSQLDADIQGVSSQLTTLGDILSANIPTPTITGDTLGPDNPRGTSPFTPSKIKATVQGAAGDQPAAAPGQPAGAKTKPGFWWGNKYVTSGKDLVAYEHAHGNAAFSLAAWARAHAPAAKKIGVPVPGTASAGVQRRPATARLSTIAGTLTRTISGALVAAPAGHKLVNPLGTRVAPARQTAPPVHAALPPFLAEHGRVAS